MSDDYEVPEDCGCEEDINHFVYNLNYFAARCHSHLTALPLNKSEIMAMFKIWLQGVQEDDPLEAHNPFGFINDFLNQSGSFSIEDFNIEDEEDEDDS